MTGPKRRTILWTPIWNKAHEGVGLEHLLVSENEANGVVIAIDDDRGPFRLTYGLTWNDRWRILKAELALETEHLRQVLSLETDGVGNWRQGDSRTLPELTGCLDIDIWPTPFTNTFPIRREPIAIGERRQFTMAWVDGPNLTVRSQRQAYTRLSERLYLFESLDGSDFKAELTVDEEGIVLDYPGFFRRTGEP